MVRTRIAPSPTGFPHIGTIFQALINYAVAKNAKGQFIVRIEDTDRKRYVEGAEDAIFDALDWFGLTPDESPIHGGNYGPYRQSEKLDRYKERAKWLVDQDKAYYCFCKPEDLDEMRKQQQKAGKPPMYNGKCRDLKPDEIKERLENKQRHVIRMKIISKEPILQIRDDIRGVIEFNPELIDDQVILKSDGFPTYHLAVVVDDHDMNITHVIRGEEWISSTPKHVLLYQYFVWDPPNFLHTPLLRNPDGSKLSKRHGHAAVSWYKEHGFLPDAILNYLANLVYSNPKGEIFSLQDFVDSFNDRTKMHSVGARFDVTKLEWINSVHIRAMSDNDLAQKLYSYLNNKYDRELLVNITPIIKQRIKKLSDVQSLIDFFITQPVIDKKLLIPKKRSEEEAVKALENVLKHFQLIEKWEAQRLHEIGNKLVGEIKWKPIELFQMIRIAVSGKTITPPLFESLEILGKEETILRIKNALKSNNQ